MKVDSNNRLLTFEEPKQKFGSFLSFPYENKFIVDVDAVNFNEEETKELRAYEGLKNLVAQMKAANLDDLAVVNNYYEQLQEYRKEANISKNWAWKKLNREKITSREDEEWPDHIYHNLQTLLEINKNLLPLINEQTERAENCSQLEERVDKLKKTYLRHKREFSGSTAKRAAAKVLGNIIKKAIVLAEEATKEEKQDYNDFVDEIIGDAFCFWEAPNMDDEDYETEKANYDWEIFCQDLYRSYLTVEEKNEYEEIALGKGRKADWINYLERLGLKENEEFEESKESFLNDENLNNFGRRMGILTSEGSWLNYINREAVSNWKELLTRSYLFEMSFALHYQKDGTTRFLSSWGFETQKELFDLLKEERWIYRKSLWGWLEDLENDRALAINWKGFADPTPGESEKFKLLSCQEAEPKIFPVLVNWAKKVIATEIMQTETDPDRLRVGGYWDQELAKILDQSTRDHLQNLRQNKLQELTGEGQEVAGWPWIRIGFIGIIIFSFLLLLVLVYQSQKNRPKKTKKQA